MRETLFVTAGFLVGLMCILQAKVVQADDSLPPFDEKRFAREIPSNAILKGIELEVSTFGDVKTVFGDGNWFVDNHHTKICFVPNKGRSDIVLYFWSRRESGVTYSTKINGFVLYSKSTYGDGQGISGFFEELLDKGELPNCIRSSMLSHRIQTKRSISIGTRKKAILRYFGGPKDHVGDSFRYFVTLPSECSEETKEMIDSGAYGGYCTIHYESYIVFDKDDSVALFSVQRDDIFNVTYWPVDGY